MFSHCSLTGQKKISTVLSPLTEAPSLPLAAILSSGPQRFPRAKEPRGVGSGMEGLGQVWDGTAPVPGVQGSAELGSSAWQAYVREGR